MRLPFDGRFASGHYHHNGIRELQIPNGVQFWDGSEEGVPNPGGDFPFMRPETRVLTREFIPPQEQADFFGSGTHTLKIFGGWKALFYGFSWAHPGNAQGWEYVFPVYADMVERYDENGKVFVSNGGMRLAWLPEGGTWQATEWTALEPGRRVSYRFSADSVPAGARVMVQFRHPLPLLNTGIFTNDWQLALAEDVAPVPPVVPPVTPPTPPPPGDGLIDVWEFFSGGLRPGQRGKPYMMAVFSGSGSRNTERYQNWLSEDGQTVTITKNQLYERYRLVGDVIQQVRDTSPDPSATGGVPHYYEVTHQRGGGYIPRYMQPGEVWKEPQPHRVEFFNKKTGALWAHPPTGVASNTNRLRVISQYQIETGNPDGELHVWEKGTGRVGWKSQWGQAFRVSDDPGPHDNEIEQVAEPVRPNPPPVVPPPVVPPPGPIDTIPPDVARTATAVVESHPSRIAAIDAAARPACLRAIMAAGMVPVSSEIAFTQDGRRWSVQAGRADQTTDRYDVLFLWTAGWAEAQAAGQPAPPPPPVVPPPPPPNRPILDVPLLSQRDRRWADVTLGQPTGHGKTIGNWGCLLVAYTMQAAHLGLHPPDPERMNALMVSRRAIVQQFVQPAALSTTFPDSLKYDGYLNRDNPRMADKIRECLRAGMPVPARVDFNPATAQWEQHWVLIVGEAVSGDWLIADPWHGDMIQLSTRYGIAGSDVLEAIFYKAVINDN